MEWLNVFINFDNFGHSILDNTNWDKIIEGINNKNPYLEQSETFFERKKYDRKQWYLSQIYTIPKYIKKVN